MMELAYGRLAYGRLAYGRLAYGKPLKLRNQEAKG